LDNKSFKELKSEHIKDYQKLYSRVELNLGSSEISNRPTNERLSSFKQDEDPALVALLYQFGRYLLISSSRPGTQPANLQGIWNDKMAPPWDSKYTININTEMNYWPAEITNLSECTEPLIKMVENFLKPVKMLPENITIWMAGLYITTPIFGGVQLQSTMLITESGQPVAPGYASICGGITSFQAIKIISKTEPIQY